MLTLLAATAFADDCAERITADGYRERVEALVRGIGGDEDQSAEVAAIETLIGCVDGPIGISDAAMYLAARGAWGARAPEPDETAVANDLVSAWRIGGGAVWDPTAFAHAEERWAAAMEAPDQFGELDLDFHHPPDFLILDGGIEYDLGPRDILSGWHLLQWQTALGWDGAWVLLEDGGSIAFPGENQPEMPTVSFTGSGGGDQGDGGVTIDTGKPPRERAERDDLKPWAELAGGALRYSADATDGFTVWEGSAYAPTLRAAGRYPLVGPLLVGAQGRVGPGSSGARPGFASGVSAIVGAGFDVGVVIEADLGVGVGSLPGAVATEEQLAAPDFDGQLALAPMARLCVEGGSALIVTGEVQGAKKGDGTEVEGALGAAWVNGAIAPGAWLRGGMLTRPGVLADYPERYSWLGLEVGGRWAL